MAWNGSNKTEQTDIKLKGEGSSRLLMYGGTIGIMIIAVAVFWVYSQNKGDDDEIKEYPKKTSIQHIAPDVSRPIREKITKTKNKPKSESHRKNKKSNERPQQLGEVRNGYVLLGSGLHRIRGEVTNNCSLTKGKYEIFKHSAENTIAELLTVKAGDILVGEPDYQGAFAESLKRSLLESIKIEDTDTPEQIELKQAVIEAKEELKKAMERGEDVEDVLISARRECQDLARVKQLMMADVFDFVDKEAVTKDDVETYVEAANKLLESKGIAPIERSTLADIKLRHKLDDFEPEAEEEDE